MTELTGILSAKYFAQNSTFRTFVKRSGFMSNKNQHYCINKQGIALLNSQNMELVELFLWPNITTIKIDPKTEDFTISVLNKKKKTDKITFSAPNRSQILCKTIKAKFLSSKTRESGINITKLKYSGAQKEYNLYVRGYGIILEHKTTMMECTEYLFSDFKELITISDCSGGFGIILQNGNIHFFISLSYQSILNGIIDSCNQIGINLNKRTCLQEELITKMLEFVNTEQMFMNLAEFKVKKKSEFRHTSPVDRVITISEKWFVERDAKTYGIVKMLPLITIKYICRPDDPQSIIITFMDNYEFKTYEYISTVRDQLICTLFDCTVVLNKDIIISEMPLYLSLIVISPSIQDIVELEGQLIKNISNFNPEYPTKENFNVKEYFMMQIFLFNANILISPKYTDNNRQYKDIIKAIDKILNYAISSEQLLRCLSSFFSIKSGYECFGENQQVRELVLKILCSGLGSAKDIIIFHSLTLLSTLLSPRFEETTIMEKINKKFLIGNKIIIDKLFNILLLNLKQMNTLFVMQCISNIVLIICEPYNETTELIQFQEALNKILDLDRDLFKLFHQSQCLSVIHTAGKIMKTIVEEGSDIQERISRIQISALVEGATLQQLYISCFMIPKTKQQALYKNISILLLDLWTTGNKESSELLSRIIPPALLRYLLSKEIPPEEDLKLDSENDKKSYVPLSVVSQFWKNWNSFSRPKHKGEIIRTRTKKLLESKKNWKMFLYQLKKDHQNVALIWNHHTREELKECLEAEIRVFQEQQQIVHDGYVSWNHQEFIVPYHCLDKEICVGTYYLRLLLNPMPDEEIPKIENPQDFFDKLFHRSLFEKNIELQVLSIQSMNIVYQNYIKEIGIFDDIGHIIKMLKTTTHKLLRDRLLQLIQNLLFNEKNAKLFIDNDGISLFVDLMTLSQLTCDHSIIPLQSNLITNGEIGEGEWYYSVIIIENGISKKIKKGPVKIKDLQQLFKEEIINKETLIWCQGMEDWKQLQDIVQLHWTILNEGHGILTDIELTLLILEVLINLVKMYPTRDIDKGIIRPLPRPKRILSSNYFLPHVVQLLLTYNPQIVDRTSRLLFLLLEDNMAVQPKFYLYGIFFFVLMYPGSNIIPLCQLLKETHRHQTISDSIELSVLNSLLPPALINSLDKLSPSDFASIYLGEIENPEVIWNIEMRKFLVDTINQHVGNFPERLSINPKAVFSYVPIAPIVFKQLEDELYCSKYYLKHFCDTIRYPNWPVENPVVMLQEILKAWVKESEKKQEKMTFKEACSILIIPMPNEGQQVDTNLLRKSYYKLASKYHPDKNPEGREIFESINEAYNFIIEHKGKNETSHDKIILLIRAQIILYKYYSESLAPFKYAGYSLLLNEAEKALEKYDKITLCYVSELIWLTLQASTLNVEEVRRVGGLKILSLMLEKTVSLLNKDINNKCEEVLSTHCILKSFAVAAQFDECRNIIKLTKGLINNLTKCLQLPTLAKVLESALDCVSCFSLDSELQNIMFNENYLILIVPHLFRFDYTLSGSGIDVNEESSQQVVYNSIACASLVALRRLCGLSGECPNNLLASCLNALLTPAITSQMELTTPHDLLNKLNSNVETPFIIWNSICRNSLLKYCELHTQRIPDWKPIDSANFIHKNIIEELYISGIYVRVFNEQILTLPKIEVKQFLIGLCEITTQLELKQNLQLPKDCTQEYINDLIIKWYRQTAEAISNIIKKFEGMDEFLCSRRLSTLEHLFKFFLNKDIIVCKNMLSVVELLSRNSNCVKAIAEQTVLCYFFQLIYSQPTLYEPIFVTLQSLLCNNTIVQLSLSLGCLLYLLWLFTSATERGNDIRPRILAAQTIAKISSNPVQGPRVTITVNKFLPQAFIASMKTEPESAVALFESTSENPEIIWTSSMKNTIRLFLDKMCKTFYSKQLEERSTRWNVPEKFIMQYEETKNLLFIGGVFVELFNKQPNWPLRDQNEFSDSLLSKMIDICNNPLKGQSVDTKTLGIISTAIAGLYTNQPSVLDHVAKAGHLSKIIEMLNSDLPLFRDEIIILQVVGVHKGCCAKLSEYNTINALARSIIKEGSDIPLISDAFKNILQTCECQNMYCIVSQLLEDNILNVFFKILDGSLDKILKEESSETKARIVEGLQKGCEDTLHGQLLNDLLDQFPVWKEYSRQKHSLFLTSGPTIAGYIAGPTTSGPVGLLSDVAHNNINRPDKPPELE